MPAPPSPGNGTKRSGTGRGNGDLDRLLADLPEGDRVLFGTLREWRSSRARKDGVPPYVVFTNKELLAIVKAKPQTPNALQGLDGIGPGKVERYGKALLARLHGSAAEPAQAPSAPADAVEASS